MIYNRSAQMSNCGSLEDKLPENPSACLLELGGGIFCFLPILDQIFKIFLLSLGPVYETTSGSSANN